MVILTSDRRITLVGPGQQLSVESSPAGQWQLVVHPGRLVIVTGRKTAVTAALERIREGLLDGWATNPNFYFSVEDLMGEEQ